MTVRIAILSTPRSGNNWLRSLLADLYEVPQLAIHNPADLDWATVPSGCILGIHWHRTPTFLRLLEENGFRVVSMLRHPLDVLLSILQFCQHERATLRWLDGEGGNEGPIYGAMPGSIAFAEYATGPRAAALLSVSPQWWQAPEVHKVRYEDLVANPEGELERLAQWIGESPRRHFEEVAGRSTLAGLRTRTGVEHHFWQGRPGLWKTLLTASTAAPIARAHPTAFACDYSCDPDSSLTPAQADHNWVSLVGSAVADKLYHLAQTSRRLVDAQGVIRQLEQQRAELEQALQRVQGQTNDFEQKLEQKQGELGCVRAELQEVHHAFQAASAELDHYHQLDPLTLGLAWKLHNLSHRCPILWKALKNILLPLRRLLNLGRRLFRHGAPQQA